MDIATPALGGFLAIAAVVAMLALAAAWVLLPFAMFGTKPLLRDLLAEQKRTNELLARIDTTGKPPA